jgi:hypothetical protein
VPQSDFRGEESLGKARSIAPSGLTPQNTGETGANLHQSEVTPVTNYEARGSKKSPPRQRKLSH